MNVPTTSEPQATQTQSENALVLALHGLRIFDKIPFLNGAWERREVEKYLGRRL